MPIPMLDAVEFSKIPALNFIVPVVAGPADPSPVTAADKGWIIYNLTSNSLKYCDGAGWIALGAAGAGGPPSGGAGGELAGTYPNPSIAKARVATGETTGDGVGTAAANAAALRAIGSGANQVVAGNDARLTDSRPPNGTATGDLTGTYPGPTIAALAVTDAKVAAANKDGAAATPSMRTLGTGANQAAPGNDSRFGAASPPNGAASGDLTGNYPGPTIAALVVTDAKVAAANKDGAVGTPSMRTLGSGAQQALAGNTPLNSITAPVGAVSLNSQKITNLAEPTNNSDGATKNYVDLTSQGLSFKNAVRVVSTTNQASLSGFLVIDGVTTALNDRVLLAGQTTQTQNGIWTASSGAWVRSQDADASGEIKDGTVVPVAEGTTGADSLYICTGVGTAPWVPGTNISTWTKYGGLSDLVAGFGLTKTGTTIDFVGDANLNVAADLVSVVSAPKWTTSRTITLGSDLSGSVALDGSANVTLNATVASSGGYYVPRFFSGDVPAGTACPVAHNLNTYDVAVDVFLNSGTRDTVLCDVERTSTSTVTLRFASAVSAGQYRCVVVGR